MSPSDASTTRPDELALSRRLLEIGAVALSPDQPFLWASGLHAPIYCDNRLTLSHPDLRSRIADNLARLVTTIRPAPAAVVGVATAGIPHATLVADRLDLPLAYVRSSPKKHGRRNQIEGGLAAGQCVVLIEDLISTGGSSLAAVSALREAGVKVDNLVAVFSYGLDVAGERFREAGIELQTLLNLETLLEVAEEDDRLNAADLQSLRMWRSDPMEWSSRFKGKRDT